MQFGSKSRRRAAAVATGTLAMGALAMPVMLAGPAQAVAGTSALPISVTCTSNFGPMTYAAVATVTTTVDGEDTDFSVEMGDMTNPIPVPLMGKTITVDVLTSVPGVAADVMLTGSVDANVTPQVDIPFPTVVGTAAGVDVGPLDMTVKSFKLTMVNQGPTPGTPTVVNCTSVAMAGPTTATIDYTCSTWGQAFDYPATINFTTLTVDNKTLVSAAMSDMPNPAPVSVPSVKMVGTLSATIAGAVVNLEGRMVGSLAPGSPVVMPKLNAVVDGTVTGADVAPAAFTAKAGASTTIPCVKKSTEPTEEPTPTPTTPTATTPAPTTPTVKPTPTTPAVVAVASKTAVKAKVNKKKKQAVLNITVTGAPTKANGTAKVVVKLGKKTFKTVNATVKNGAAKVTIKKLKKGKYKATASFAGDAANLASSGKVNFKF